MTNAIKATIQAIAIFTMFSAMLAVPFVAAYAWLAYAVPAIH